jgi:uncharacterized protein YndB with AHSA1/START domain
MATNFTATAEVGIKAPVSKVWDGLTRPEIIKQYFFGTNTETEWKVGGPIKFSGEYQGHKYEDKGTVLAFEPQRLIKYKYWSSMSGTEDKPENYLTITYQLEPLGDATLLRIVQEDVKDEATKNHSEENWKKVLAGLKTLLEDGQEIAAY